MKCINERCVTYCLTMYCALLFSIIIACLFSKRIAHFAYTPISCFVRFFFQSIFSRYCLVPFNDVLLIHCCYNHLCECVHFSFISHSDTHTYAHTRASMHAHYLFAFGSVFSHTHSFHFISFWIVRVYIDRQKEWTEKRMNVKEKKKWEVHARVCWYARSNRANHRAYTSIYMYIVHTCIVV